MNLNITIDLEAAIAAALSPEKLQPILDKHVTEAITDAIRDATGYRSTFRESIKEQLASALPHGIAIDDVAKFQHVLNATVNKLVQECNNNAVHTAMDAAVKEVMPDVPAVLKMSELIQEARDGFHKEQHEGFYAYFQPSDHGGGGWLYLDSNERPGHSSYGERSDRKYSAAHQLAFTKEGQVYSLKLRDKVVTPASRPDVISRFDSLMMAMYVGRTTLEVDMDDDDIESASGEQYD